MPTLNWTQTSAQTQHGPHAERESELVLTLPEGLAQELGEALRSVFSGQTRELRLELPGAWTIYWKLRDQGTRLLLAHPETDQWVTTVAFDAVSGAALVQALGQVARGETSHVALSRWVELDFLSNLELTIRCAS